MHMPDGFASAPVIAVTSAISVAATGLALARARREIDDRAVPALGVCTAFIFAAQMINFPVAGGTSGHLLGGALAAITLGPWAGMLVMASVIGVQGLLFQDGGLIAMGANIFNMGLLTALIGYGLYQLGDGRPHAARMVLAGAGAWLSVLGGALATALELWLSGTASLAVVVPAMLSMHALIGIGEALITVATLNFILRVRPDVLGEASQRQGGRGWVIAGLGLSLVVVLLAPLASAAPDGLNRVAIDLGFMGREAGAPFRLLSGYTVPFLGNTPLSTVLAGAVGTLAVAGVAYVLVRLIRRRDSQAG